MSLSLLNSILLTLMTPNTYHYDTGPWDGSSTKSLVNAETEYAYLIRFVDIKVTCDANAANRYILMRKKDHDDNSVYETYSCIFVANEEGYIVSAPGLTYAELDNIAGVLAGCVLPMPFPMVILPQESLVFAVNNEQAADNFRLKIQYSKVKL